MGTRRHGDAETRGHGDAETRGRGDAGTRGHGDTGTRGRGDAEMEVLLPAGVAVAESREPEPEPIISSYVLEPVAAAAAVVVAQAQELPWTLSTWSGLPQWRCTLCPFDTLDGEDAMIVHIEARHGPTPTAAPLVQAYDARGNPI